MGHALPTKEEVARSIAAEKRRNYIHSELQTLPMSSFTIVGEFLSLVRFVRNIASEDDLCLLERKISDFNHKNSWCTSCHRTLREDEVDHRC